MSYTLQIPKRQSEIGQFITSSFQNPVNCIFVDAWYSASSRHFVLAIPFMILKLRQLSDTDNTVI